MQSTTSATATATAASPTTLLVTGASGTTGAEVLRLLTTSYRDRFTVVAGVHAQDAPTAAVDAARRIDADDLATLDFTGIDALFIIPSNAENRVEQTRNYVEAAKRDGVRYILLLSVILSEQRDTVFARQFHDCERFVSDSGIPCTFLRCTFFQQNFFAHAEEIARFGTLSLPIRMGKCAPVNVRDVARAACAILANSALHVRKAYDLVGPDLLDGPGLAAAASRGLGVDVRFVDCPRADFLRLYQDQGVPAWLASGFAEILDLVAADKLATFETRAFFEDLTSGASPVTVEQFFAENRDRFLPGRSTQMMEKPITTSSSYDQPRTTATTTMGSGAMVPGDDLVDLLHQLVLDKQQTLQRKRESLRKEEARLDRLIDLFERVERTGGLQSTRPSGGRYMTRGGEYEPSRGYYEGGSARMGPGEYGTTSRRCELSPYSRYFEAATSSRRGPEQGYWGSYSDEYGSRRPATTGGRYYD